MQHYFWSRNACIDSINHLTLKFGFNLPPYYIIWTIYKHYSGVYSPTTTLAIGLQFIRDSTWVGKTRFHYHQGLCAIAVYYLHGLGLVLRLVKWVTLRWFLFGVHPYQPTLDFALFILEWAIKSVYDVTSSKRASKRLWEAIKL